MRETIRSVVEAITPLDGEESAHRDRVLDWIDSGAEIIRTAKPATPPMHLVSYCVLVDGEGGRALLVDHRDAHRWLPTGGHVEHGEHPADTAQREMLEELGIEPEFHPLVGRNPLMVTVTETAGLSARHTDVSLWFAFDGSGADRLSPDAGEFVGAQWWDFGDIEHGIDTRFDPHLPRFIAKLVGRSS